jgi:hypothetical protein
MDLVKSLQTIRSKLETELALFPVEHSIIEVTDDYTFCGFDPLKDAIITTSLFPIGKDEGKDIWEVVCRVSSTVLGPGYTYVSFRHFYSAEKALRYAAEVNAGTKVTSRIDRVSVVLVRNRWRTDIIADNFNFCS